jgi:hypothetical protein
MSTKKTIQKLDLRQQWKHLYSPSARQAMVVEVPDLNFIMIDGQVEPGLKPGDSPGFGQAFQALYGAAYTLKFMSKRRGRDPIDFKIMTLEGLWWTDGEFDLRKPGDWRWTMMLMQPDHITAEMLATAQSQLRAKKDNPAIERLRLERFEEGLCVQIMHIGPYAEEPATLDRLNAFAWDSGYALRGKHHEIYLGDPRRTKPERLRTILRHPVERR